MQIKTINRYHLYLLGCYLSEKFMPVAGGSAVSEALALHVAASVTTRVTTQVTTPEIAPDQHQV